MQGYHESPEATRESITEDGWMKTGDLAVIDAEGYCSVVGRLKDTIIRGGENIAPTEVEVRATILIAFGIPVASWGQLSYKSVSVD